MANIKITDLTAYGNPTSTDVLPIVDVGADVTKKVSVGDLVGRITGDVEVATDGTSSIAAGVIVDADVNTSAAIAGTKIDPDFGSQTIETTGVINAGSGTEAAPAITVGTTDNGLYSPGTDEVAFSINGLERMIIKSDGDILFEKSSNTSTSRGFEYRSGLENQIFITNSNAIATSPLIRLNRQASDGDLISFRQADVAEGIISVSGTSVTYGGGHLARWSQLPNDEDPSNILKGTVMSNLDEMCEWGEEDNEQLNKTKVSDVEGDPNVAGVFVSTSFSEEGPLDFFVGMTGDMIIRIANGVTVQRGDLLMSAGDGTAKPQGDDIIRSKTIAKVTSTHVPCTYDDGSYCVPCVLMAC